MQVKKFEAPTIQEALDTIKRELGPEAIILQTKRYKRGFGLLSKGSVEVTAAVSARSLQKKKYTEDRLPEPTRGALQKLSASNQADVYDKALESAIESTSDRVEMSAGARQTARKAIRTAVKTAANVGGPASLAPASAPDTAKITKTRYADIQDEGAATPRSSVPAPEQKEVHSLEDEVRQLKRILSEMKNAQDEGLFGSGAQSALGPVNTFSPAMQDAFDQLTINGVDRRLALAAVKKAGFELGPEHSQSPEEVLDRVAVEIMESVEVVSPLSHIKASTERTEGARGPAVIALVGPTGVGKTTTIAKMASEALLKRNLKVGLINVDSYKVAAFDQLATYAKILNVPFRSASSAEDLRSAVGEMAGLDLVLIDTTGRSQKDPNSLQEMQALLAHVPNVEFHLLLSATTRDAELYDMANRFSLFRPVGISFSKLDEATLFGALYNVSRKAKLPLLYFTTGQRVPEDLESASRERVVSLIMEL